MLMKCHDQAFMEYEHSYLALFYAQLVSIYYRSDQYLSSELDF